MRHILTFLQRIPLQQYKIVRFLISGGTATGINFVVLYALVDWAQLWYLPASLIALAFALVISFMLQKFWTFESRTMSDARRQFPLYVGVGLLDLVLNSAFLYVFVEYAHLWYLAGQFCCSALLAVMNYLLYRHFIFSTSPTE